MHAASGQRCHRGGSGGHHAAAGGHTELAPAEVHPCTAAWGLHYSLYIINKQEKVIGAVNNVQISETF